MEKMQPNPPTSDNIISFVGFFLNSSKPCVKVSTTSRFCNFSGDNDTLIDFLTWCIYLRFIL